MLIYSLIPESLKNEVGVVSESFDVRKDISLDEATDLFDRYWREPPGYLK